MLGTKKPLLIITQKVDIADPVLGFFHTWLVEFAKQTSQLTVICLEMGEYDLPSNVKVLSLGKERGVGRLGYITNLFKYLWQERRNYKTVLVHMNTEYVVLAGWWWRLTGKTILLWYVHRQVNYKLRVATFFANDIFTASKQSFNIKTNKLHIVEHGIDTSLFVLQPHTNESELKLVSVGRITEIKHLDTLVGAVAKVGFKTDRLVTLTLVGGTVTEADREYKSELSALINSLNLNDQITFKGELSYLELAKIYPQFDIAINLAPTGGVDKAVLEAMAAGVLPLVCNESFETILNNDNLIFKFEDSEDLANKIVALAGIPNNELRADLRERVVANFGLAALIGKLLRYQV